MAEENVTLELLLTKATSPALHDDDFNAISAFCDQVNKEHEGPQLAVRLLAHKIQSPTEREALSALSTLECCVKSCGQTFHKEIGKFRFLNEIIKMLSPKYLGGKTTERVKKRSIELLYSWHKGLPHETKIGDAYKMLREEKIIKEDPTYMDKTFDPFPAPKPRRADFEDEERAKRLSCLLKSKKPGDLQAANKLIKDMVKEDAEKSERRSRRMNELETITTQVKLLTEMVKCFNSSSARSDIDMMKELYENLEKQRPKLFRLAGETEEQETDAINEILAVNDGVTKAMSLYMTRVKGAAEENGEAQGAARDTSLLDLGFDSRGQPAESSSEQASGASAILHSEFQSLGLAQSPPTASPYSNIDSFLTSHQQQQQQQQAGRMSLAQAAMGAPGAAGFPAQNQTVAGGVPTPVAQPQYSAAAQLGYASNWQSTVFSATTSASAATVVTSSSAAAAAPSPAMADLEAIGQSLLEKNRTKDFVRPPVGPPPKLTMNQLAAARTTPQQNPQPTPAQPTSAIDSPLKPSPVTSTVQNFVPNAINGNVQPSNLSATNPSDSSVFSPMVSAPLPISSPSSQELLPLTNVFVSLESIKPAEDMPALTIYDKNGLKSMIHFSKERPRPDVMVMVLSTLSTNAKPVKTFAFQAAVPKVMKVKLQPPSVSDLPAFNPILPPAAITQVLLIANPRKEKIRLKFKISYILGDESVSDVGEAENFFVQ